jgi:ADP-heptose:LPS heptosyltransferase
MASIARRDIAAMATQMRTLDLVISVDTMQAHLAGALGTPTWLLLNKQCDWRWMRDRDDTPWYPTMRLFRQTQQDNWDEVIANVASKLLTLTRAHDIHSTGCTASSG